MPITLNSDLNTGGGRIAGLPDPVTSNEAANKDYVDVARAVTTRIFNDLTGLLASTSSFSTGTLIFVFSNEATYEVITGPGASYDLTTAGGAVLRVKAGVGGQYYATHFGAIHESTSDQHGALAKMVAAVKALVDSGVGSSGVTGSLSAVFDGNFTLGQTLTLNTRAQWYFQGILKASDTFTISTDISPNYMLNVDSLNGDLYEMRLACNHRASGVKMTKGQTYFHNPVVERFKFRGISLEGSAGDTKVIQPFITQIFSSDSSLFANDTNFDGVAIYMGRADDEIIGGVTRYCGTCIYVAPTAKTTWITGHHPYNGRPVPDTNIPNPRANAILIEVAEGATGINILDCYLDNGQVLLRSHLVSMRDCRFLANPDTVDLPGDAIVRVYPQITSPQNQPWQLDIDVKVIDRSQYPGLQDIEYMSGFTGVYTGFVANIPDGAALQGTGGKFTIFHTDTGSDLFETIYKPLGEIQYNYRIGAVGGDFVYQRWADDNYTIGAKTVRHRPNGSLVGTELFFGSTGSNGIVQDSGNITIQSGPGVIVESSSGTVTLGTTSAQPLLLKSNGVTRAEIPSTGHFRPFANNAYTLGAAGFLWKEIFCVTNVINTSDERQKEQIRDLDEIEKRVAQKLKSLIKVFKFKDAVEKKGNTARKHIGVIAQEVVAAFKEEGLDAFEYGIVCYDKWGEEPEMVDKDGNVIREVIKAGDSYGVRYEELSMFILSAI